MTNSDTPDSRLRYVESQEFAQIIIVSANPNGTIAQAESVFAWDAVNKNLYINTDGSTTWALII